MVKIILSTIYQLYFNRFLQLYPGYKKLVLEISENLRKSYEQTVAPSDKDILPSSSCDAIQLYENCDLLSKVGEFESSFTNQQKFIMTYMKQFETILMYVRATREKNSSCTLNLQKLC